MKKLQTRILLLAAAAALTLAACSPKDNGQGGAPSVPPASEAPSGASALPEAAGPSDPGREAPLLGSFTAADLDGTEVNQEIFQDHDLTMVNVWATFCGPCLREMPDLGKIHEEYKDQGFQIVGIVMDVLDPEGRVDQAQVETAKEVVTKTGADYTHLLPSNDLIGLMLADIYAVPTTFFVDRDGNLVGEPFSGARSEKAWKELIDAKLEEVR